MEKVILVHLLFAVFNIALIDADIYTEYTDDAFEESMLEWHNAARAMHGAAPLTWNTEAAAFAQNWCQYLGDNDLFEHAPWDGEDGRGVLQLGENLAAKYSTYEFQQTQTATYALDAIKDWYYEMNNYNFEDGTKRDETAGSTGHFTQVVWSDTSSIGCGYASREGGDWPYSYWMCCNYHTPGNYMGEYTQQVAEPTGCFTDEREWCSQDLMCVEEGEECPNSGGGEECEGGDCGTEDEEDEIEDADPDNENDNATEDESSDYDFDNDSADCEWDDDDCWNTSASTRSSALCIGIGVIAHAGRYLF